MVLGFPAKRNCKERWGPKGKKGKGRTGHMQREPGEIEKKKRKGRRRRRGGRAHSSPLSVVVEERIRGGIWGGERS